MQSLYAAASGLSSQQKRLETLSANVANASTVGYKATRTDFKDALYSAMDNPVLADSTENNLLTGSGVLLGSTSMDFTAGTITQTGNLLDFAIEGDGFFGVQNQAGETLYTRDGAFSAAEMDGKTYLVTAQGQFVLDNGGNRIEIAGADTVLRVAENGQLQAADGTTVTIGLYRFTNPEGLAPTGGNSFQATEVSGQPETAEDIHIVQGSLENSNVNLAQELTLLIRAQRAYSMASRALTTSDQMLGLANNVR
jgi:flagellar basal-body rod protein FlgG